MSRRLVLALGGGALLVALVLLLVLPGGADRPGTAAATGSPSSSSATAGAGAVPTQGPVVPTASGPASTGPGTATAPPGPGAPGGGPAGQRPPELSPVPLDAGATVPGVVTGRLVSVEAVQATGTGVGNISGPGLRVTVELTGAARTLSLDGSFVELLTGADLAPASPVDDPSSAPLQGQLPQGGTATGVYVFGVDEGARGDVTVRVQPAPGEPFLVFRGAVG